MSKQIEMKQIKYKYVIWVLSFNHKLEKHYIQNREVF